MVKIWVIAMATFKEGIRQPIFFVLLFVAAALLLISTVLPYYTLGEDLKMLKDTGLATIKFSALLVALLTASTSIAEEIEGKTAITLLSKPISRRQFIVGKFFGIILSASVLFVALGALFLLIVFYKVGYDAREMARPVPPVADRLAEVWQIAPGLVLALFEVAVLSSISVAISTRLPMLMNLVICLAIFILGHLTPILVQATAGGFELVSFMAGLFSVVFASLEVYNVEAAIATGREIPWAYVFWSFVYTAAYSTAALLLAFILFEDRDLA